jgi:hypothetical protein
MVFSVQHSGLMNSQKVFKAVTPAKAGVQNFLFFLDSGFRRNDRKRAFSDFLRVHRVWVKKIFPEH